MRIDLRLDARKKLYLFTLDFAWNASFEGPLIPCLQIPRRSNNICSPSPRKAFDYVDDINSLLMRFAAPAPTILAS